MNQKLEDLLQLALQTPEDVRIQTEDLNVGFNTESRTWELIVKYHGSLDALEALNIQVEYLIAGFALLTVPEQLVDSVAELEEIEYVEKPKRFFYGVEMPADNSCIAQVTFRHPFLTGAGVLIAVLDSGIEARLPEFRKRDGSTRIRYLWDQTLTPDEPVSDMEGVDENALNADEAVSNTTGPGNASQRPVRRPPEGFRMGVEFDSEQINKALEAPTLQQQFQLLPSTDSTGHGTAVAGIAAGNSASYQGVASESELLIVKLGQPDVTSFPRTTEVMRGVTYAIRRAMQLKMPVVVNLSFGNTYGAHDGSSLLERFLDNAAEMGRTVICVGSGNEGNSNGHLAGSLLDETYNGSRTGGTVSGSGGGTGFGRITGNIFGGSPGALPPDNAPAVPSRMGDAVARPASVELAVAEYERSLNVQLWKNYCDIYRIYLRSPGGQEAQLPRMINGGKYTLRLEQTEILVYFGEPAPYAVPEEIYFELLPLERNYINSGVWTIRLEPERAVTGRFYFYLPSSAVRSSGTGFYRSTPEVTLTIPSTAAKVLSVGAYDSTYEAYADFSGRGYADANRTIGVVAAGLAKPDLAAPGVGILAPDIYGRYAPFTGSSFATPIVSGSAALLMEWGIVRGNDPFLYGEKVKAYLRAGARALRGENTYPNSRVGWGGLCVATSLPE
ncbi:MAG TPA: peptidase S8 [Lachnospiraceae bacterium]|nr:peptidase S8 [Lachnospiraceae bacterium]